MLCFNEKITENPGNLLSTLTLPWENRNRNRLKVRLDNGDEAGIVLERGLVLHDGDLLADEDGRCIRVKAAMEPVSTVTGSDPLDLARLCYHLGNRHVELEISSNRLRYPHDHILDEMVRAMGFAVQVERAAFHPESGAYHHDHGHRHG